MNTSFIEIRNILLQYSRDEPYWWVLIILATSILLGILIRLIFYASLRTYAKRENSKVVQLVLQNLDRRTMFFFPLLVFWMLQPIVHLPQPYDELLHKVTLALLFINFGLLLLKLLGVIEDFSRIYYQGQHHNYLKERKVRTQIEFFKRVTGVLILLLVLASVLLTFESVRKIGATILTSAGVIGVIIGVAAQKTLANLIAGIQIAFTQPIKIDDAVIVENEWGTIEEITLTYVIVRVWDKRRIILPITYFVEHPFQNWTRSSAELIGAIILYVDYSLPLDEMCNQLSTILKEEPLWDEQTKVIQVTDTTEYTMIIWVLESSDSAPGTWTLRCSVREKLISYIQIQHPEALPKLRMSLPESRPTMM